jgi:outer membrane protein TolC
MNKRVLRLTGVLMLSMALLMLLSGAAWAKDTAQLDYADIALRVPKENKQLDILQRSLPLLQKSRDDLEKNTVSSSAANKAIAELTELYGKMMVPSVNPDGSVTIPTEGQMTFAKFMLQSVSMGAMSGDGMSYDAIDSQIAQMRIQIPQTQAALISGGQQLFVGYHQLQDTIRKTRDSRSLLIERVNLAKVQQTAGLGTALAVIEAELALAELDTGVAQMESQGVTMLGQLKMIVGWPQGQVIKLGAIPKPNRQFFDKIVLADDIKSAQTNSYSLKLKEQEHKYTSDEERKKLVKLNMEALTEQIALTVNTQYQKIADKNSTLLLEEQRLAVAEEKIRQSRLQFQVGVISEIALKAEENSYKAKQEAVQTAIDALFWEIESYKNIVAGLN